MSDDIRQRLTAALESDEMLKDAFRMMGLLRLFHEGSPLFAEVAASVLPTVKKIVAEAKVRQEGASEGRDVALFDYNVIGKKIEEDQNFFLACEAYSAGGGGLFAIAHAALKVIERQVSARPLSDQPRDRGWVGEDPEDDEFHALCRSYGLSVNETYAIGLARDAARQKHHAAHLPYSSPEARTKAGEALDAGRLSVHAHPSKRRQAPDFPAIDELLFNVGQNRERMNVEIEAAHALIPETLVPRNRGKTDERSIAERLRLLLQIIDRRAAALLRPETDTPQPGDAA